MSGTNNRPTPPVQPLTTTSNNMIDNELSEFFGSSASKPFDCEFILNSDK